VIKLDVTNRSDQTVEKKEEKKKEYKAAVSLS
jgi:hypothetical protein